MKQWHPVFAQLLRPAVEAYYDVQTTLPVGDAPREADFVLLRRTTQGTPPFRGLWRHLTTWNIQEFKGPTVSPRRGDVELLVELGLGIDRRLQGGRVLEQPGLQQLYGGWLASLHPTAWKEVEAMARATGRRLLFDIRPAIESLGLDRVVEQVGIDRVIESVGIDRVIESVGIDRVIE